MVRERKSNLSFVTPPYTYAHKPVVYYGGKNSIHLAEEHCQDKIDITKINKNKYFLYYRTLPPFISEPLTLEIKIKDQTFHLDHRLKDIADSIHDAAQILDFNEDWDDNGANSTNFQTFLKATNFLISYSTELLRFGVIETPFIDLMRDGSISILWDTPKASLLVIFQKNDSELSHFYGEEKKEKRPFKYALKGDEIDEIVTIWMSKYLL